MSEKKFATVINCMDGRVQIPVNDWIRKEYGVDCVDTITEPGPNRILAEKGEATESIKIRVLISVNKHGSKHIAIAGHHDCAGNPVKRELQMKHISEAINVVKSWGLNISVIGLWVDENWNVNRLE